MDCLLNINERIEAVVSYSKLSNNAFAKSINILQQTFINYLNGRVPSLELIVSIHNKYPEIDLIWLITGKGEMLKSNNYKHQDTAEYEKKILDLQGKLIAAQDTIIQLMKDSKKNV